MRVRLLGTILALCSIGLLCCSTGSLQQDKGGLTESLELLGRARVSAVYDIEVVPPYAYALERGILRVLDVRDPKAVREIGSLEFERPRSRMALRYPYLYLTGFGQPMGVIDISNRTQPQWVGELSELKGTRNDCFELAGDIGYLVSQVKETSQEGETDSLHLELLDLKNSSGEPHRLARLDLGVCNAGVEFRGIAYSDGRVFVLARRATDAGHRGEIIIVDVRVPGKPRIERTLLLPCDKLYRDVEVHGDLLFLLQAGPWRGKENGLAVFRMGAEEDPEFLGEATDPGLWLGIDLIVRNDVVYATFNGEIDLATFDVSNPVEPKIIHTYTIDDLWASGLGMTLVENRLYVAGDGGPAPVFDVSKPTAPRLLGQWAFEGGWVDDVIREGKLAILTQVGGGLIIYNVENPSMPQRLARYQAPTSNKPEDWQGNVVAAVSGSRIFIAYETLPAEVMDISNPAQPAVLGRFEPRGLVHDIVLTPTHAFLGYRTLGKRRALSLTNPPSVTEKGGVEVVDLDNPRNPHALAALGLSQAVTDIALGPDRLVASHPDGSLTIVDIHDPAQPTIAGLYDAGGSAITGFSSARSRLALSPDGNRAYVVSRNATFSGNPYIGQDTLAVIDTKDVAAPHMLGQLTFDRHSVVESSMVLLGHHIIIFSGDIVIVDVNEPTRPTVTLCQAFPPVQYWAPDRVGLALDDQFLYLGAVEDGLWVYRLPSFLRK